MSELKGEQFFKYDSAPIKIVVATTKSEDDFYTDTATGRSIIPYLSLLGISISVHFENKNGLSEVYNTEIENSKSSPSILVFMHDDVNICDFWWWSSVRLALRKFKLGGIIGNRRRTPGQPSWAFTKDVSEPDNQNYSGFISEQRKVPPTKIIFAGVACVPVKLLDGLFLFCASETLLENDIRFDEQFSFHFYDLDICRQFEKKDLLMGTWNISVVHESDNIIGKAEWYSSYLNYIKKWGN